MGYKEEDEGLPYNAAYILLPTPTVRFRITSLRMRERCILLKIQCLCGKITLQRNVHFFTGYIQETLCLKLTLHVLCSTPYGMNVTHTRISTLQGSSRGHYNGTLQLALFDKKRRKGNHCILLYSLFFLNPLDSGFRWNWRVISYSSVPTLYPFIRIRRTLIAFPPTTNVLPSCIPASFLFCPIIFHPTNLLF